jgi:Fe-S-cluster-containing dehydrogenase component
MTKCDLCYDRTSLGRAPMCATVCPSGALFYGTQDEVEDLRRARPLARFGFGDETVVTRNAFMVPAAIDTVVVLHGAAAPRSRAEEQLAECLS